MHDYLSDKEQKEVFKRWWNNYGKTIALALLIGLVIGMGWRYWQNKKITHVMRASMLYEQMIIAQSNHQNEQFQSVSGSLIKDYSDTSYGAVAALFLAQQEVQEQKLPQALAHLNWVIEHAKDRYFKEIATLRKARLLLADNKSDEALQLLSTLKSAAFAALTENVKGDIYQKLGKIKEAENAYQMAKNDFKKNKLETSIVVSK